MNFVTKEPINKGWSGDKKYCVTDENGTRYLLRVSPIEQYERKKSEYELMSQVAALGVPMCRPLEFGILQTILILITDAATTKQFALTSRLK